MRLRLLFSFFIGGLILVFIPSKASSLQSSDKPHRNLDAANHHHLKQRHSYIIHQKQKKKCLIECENYFWCEPDSAFPRCNKKKLTSAIIGISAIYGAVGTWCYFSWYKNQQRSQFQFMNEGWFEQDTYAGGTDKLGHAYSNFVMVRGVTGILEWGGLRKEYAQIIASTLALTYFTGVEIKDGYGMERSHEAIEANYDYGFSWEDMIADVAGNLLAIAFIYFPVLDELFDFRLEYWPSPEYLRLLKNGDPNASEDYSGMSYALWYHLSSIPDVKSVNHSPIAMLKYLDVGVGYHTDGFMPRTDKNKRRELFFGVALNMQQLFDDLFFEGGSKRTIARQITRCINEVLTLPGTTLHFDHTLEGYIEH